MPSVGQIIDQRRRALVQSWVDDPLIQVLVESPEALGRLVFINDAELQTEGAPLGLRSQRSVAIVQSPGKIDALSSVWVASSYRDYKGAYLAFLRRVYGIGFAASDLVGYDVDHLLNRARAPQRSTFVRLEAVPSGVNQAWGATFERAASDPRFAANRRRERRTMSYTICAKLDGQMPPSGPRDMSGIARLERYFLSIGLTQHEAESGLKEMLAFVYR